MNKREIIVALENIRSLYNIGAIYRTCEFLGVENILLIGYSGKDEREPNKIHRKLQKTSLGTINKIKTKQFRNIKEVKKHYPKAKIISIEQNKNSKPLNTFKTPENQLVLIFGNEIDGVNQETLNISDKILEIPKIGTHQSLNVATTCGIVLSYLQFGTATNP